MNPYAPRYVTPNEDALRDDLQPHTLPWRVASLMGVAAVSLWCVYWAVTISLDGRPDLLGNFFFVRHLAVSVCGLFAVFALYMRRRSLVATIVWSAIAVCLIGQMAFPGLWYGEWSVLLRYYVAPLSVALLVPFATWCSLPKRFAAIDRSNDRQSRELDA